MPLYEYECKSCGTRFEQLISDRRAKVRCKACGDPRVVRVLSTFAVISPAAEASSQAEPGPCGVCGAPQRRMCETAER
ncbi:MAG: zinc ribbon domain-containing protein [Acidobacteria bacterium]|nr:MAG: zinc ribbon domain-containing protein [Acidobacteriota bacterium]